jgi:hypothetical protein
MFSEDVEYTTQSLPTFPRPNSRLGLAEHVRLSTSSYRPMKGTEVLVFQRREESVSGLRGSAGRDRITKGAVLV